MTQTTPKAATSATLEAQRGRLGSPNLPLDHLPRSPGVYLFRGQGEFPLYIGKSVDIRTRVQSHLRSPDEARMLAQTVSIDCIETAGEIGALLLEARLIKTLSPLYNVRLRRSKSLFSLRLQAGPSGLKPELVDSLRLDFAHSPGLYGLFASRHAAQARLREWAQEHRLCLGLLGLEPMSPRGCFAWQLKRCAGACTGHEPADAHNARLLAACQTAQLHSWPFAGAVDLIEERGDWQQRHRILNWSHLGTHCSRAGALGGSAPQHGAGRFDADTYKILLRPLLLGSLRTEPAPDPG